MREPLSNFRSKQREDFFECSRARFPRCSLIFDIFFHAFNVSRTLYLSHFRPRTRAFFRIFFFFFGHRFPLVAPGVFSAR